MGEEASFIDEKNYYTNRRFNVGSMHQFCDNGSRRFEQNASSDGLTGQNGYSSQWFKILYHEKC